MIDKENRSPHKWQEFDIFRVTGLWKTVETFTWSPEGKRGIILQWEWKRRIDHISRMNEFEFQIQTDVRADYIPWLWVLHFSYLGQYFHHSDKSQLEKFIKVFSKLIIFFVFQSYVNCHFAAFSKKKIIIWKKVHTYDISYKWLRSKWIKYSQKKFSSSRPPIYSIHR